MYSKRSLEKILSNLLSNAVSYTNPGNRESVVLCVDKIWIENECEPILAENWCACLNLFVVLILQEIRRTAKMDLDYIL